MLEPYVYVLLIQLYERHNYYNLIQYDIIGLTELHNLQEQKRFIYEQDMGAQLTRTEERRQEHGPGGRRCDHVIQQDGRQAPGRGTRGHTHCMGPPQRTSV